MGERRELPPSSSLPPPTAKGGTHPPWGVGPPARWAESDFPTAINFLLPPSPPSMFIAVVTAMSYKGSKEWKIFQNFEKVLNRISRPASSNWLSDISNIELVPPLPHLQCIVLPLPPARFFSAPNQPPPSFNFFPFYPFRTIQTFM